LAVAKDRITVQWHYLIPFAGMAIATLAGVIINTSPYSHVNGTPGYAVNVFWSIFNIAVLSLTAAVCVELPKKRKDDRFQCSEPMELAHGGERIPCTALDISVGGARLYREDGWPGTMGNMLSMDGGTLEIPCEAVRIDKGDLTVRFNASPETRRRLILKLYTGAYANEVTRIRMGRVLLRLIAVLAK
ncbi:MAG: PilZ domain-containing protein, partial [Proteobacteria bacterium]|nr:PilZ domain-containing protein [Pseudomonadota bacterium]